MEEGEEIEEGIADADIGVGGEEEEVDSTVGFKVERKEEGSGRV